MEILFGIGGSLFQLLILVGIVASVVWFFRRRAGSQDDPGIGTLKRFYFYGLSFIAMMVAASGAAVLVDYGADRALSPAIFSRGESQLALGLAMFLVGTPIWLVHWKLAQRVVVRIPWESQALARRIYVYLVLSVSAALVAIGLVSLFRVWLGADSFNGVNLALPVVWGSLWVYHWQVFGSETWTNRIADPVRRFYVYVSSWYGLGMLAVGVGMVLWRMLLSAYDSLFATELLVSRSSGLWSDVTASGVAVALVGGLFWWWHWHRVARADAGSLVRQIYLHFFTILPGSATVLVSLTIILFRVLQLAIGEPDSPAADHFRVLPGAVAALFAGIGLWGYHWALARQEAPAMDGLPAARRVYRYLAAATGLVGLAVGAVFLLAVGIGLLAPLGEKTLVGAIWWRDPLALAVTLLLVGVPLWAYHWFGAQREAIAGGAEELNAPSRRIFVHLVFGASVLLVLGNLSAVLFMVFRDALEGALGPLVIQETKWSLAIVLMAGAVSVYYWLVLREDQQALPSTGREMAQAASPPTRKAVIAVATEAARPLILQIEARLGFPIRLWQRLDPGAGVPDLSDEDLDTTRDSISAAPGDRVLLTLDASGVKIVPFRE